jgi:hypothetical protein
MISPLLACGSMRFSAADMALVYALIAGWVASLLLAFVNPYLIGRSQISSRSKSLHWLVWSVYVVSGLVVCTRGLGGMQGAAWLIPIIAVPNLAVAQFLVLLCTPKWSRPKKQTPPDF